MKVITKCVISMSTLQIVKEESYKYTGPTVMCKGGGGGGSGVVDFPDYMKTIHNDWLDNTGLDTITSSITDIMDAAQGNSPWTGEVAYDPDTELVSLLAAPDTLQTLVTLLSSGTTLDTLISSILDQSRIDDAVTEFAADLDARLTVEVLPRFEAGMRDINAVVSSAFVIGRAIIEDGQTRQVSKYSADLHNKAFSDDAIQVINLKLEYQKVVSSMIAEANRIKIVAKKEETDTNLKIDEEDALWDLEVFQYGANLLGAIGGGTALPKVKGPSTAQSAIGGAMTGAASGAMIGSVVPGVGTVTGAVAGGILGAGSAFL